MKKIIIGTIVTALILFIVQALNWTMLPVHNNAIKYSPGQDKILKVLEETLDDGYYFLPFYDIEKTSSEEQSRLNAEMKGKSWATISYHKSYDQNMTVTMAAGFLIHLMAAFIVVIILAMVSDKIPSFGGRWLFVISLAALIILQGPMVNWNWWETPDHFLKSIVFDQITTWGIAGLWIAWYFRVKPEST